MCVRCDKCSVRLGMAVFASILSLKRVFSSTDRSTVTYSCANGSADSWYRLLVVSFLDHFCLVDYTA